MKKSLNDTLTIALPKGRILKEAATLFRAAGVDFSEILQDERKLIFENIAEGLRFMVIRSQDVPTYVEYGAADMGIAGKDVLMEQQKDLYEPLDLKIGACRMMVAEPKELVQKDNPRHWTHIRVATKYPNITLKYFLDKGIQVEIIKLYGSIELAPLLGLSERIVDLVQTGETLRKNGLVEVETITEISSKLVCNRASLKTKPRRVKDLVERLTKAVAASGK
ncbi:MAG: ATP phosphoribosyltransferase [Deltaproteobacteria bacterium GWC2_56_8]|nr:MAG: ATP phosphoribosyltransferase [Deltaproteobacteria bacterium GWB2_55_19]OGP38858.1 MAG: ATP phosphoribosyltransferase [Deltaproteobacteria bacterium GWC2_56_8]